MQKGWQKYKLLDLFPAVMFWDVDPNRLDWKDDADFIIPRVLQWHLDNEEILYNLDKIYNKDAILYFAKNSRGEIRGNENIEFFCKHYNVAPESFPQYIKNIQDYV